LGEHVSKLNFTQTKSNGTLSAKLDGEIIDGCAIPDPDLSGVNQVELDLDGVRYLNSSGARLWLLWSGKLAGGRQKIFLNRVRPVFIRTLASIRDFLPKGAKLNSVYVPYFCESCNNNYDRLMVNGQDFTRSPNRRDLESHPCPKCGQASEIDALVESYANAFEAFG